MSTRSHIAILHTDGMVKSIYAHWDGYLSGNGRILLENYKTLSNVWELLHRGDVSALAETLEETKFYGSRSTWGPGEQDELWENVKPKNHESLADFREYLKGSWTEFVYVFDVARDGRWTWNRTGEVEKGAKLHNLTEKMVSE